MKKGFYRWHELHSPRQIESGHQSNIGYYQKMGIVITAIILSSSPKQTRFHDLALALPSLKG